MCILLEGLPHLQNRDKPLIGADAPEPLNCELQIDITWRGHLGQVSAICAAKIDTVSRQPCDTILQGTEAHVDHFEPLLGLIKHAGQHNHLHSQMN